MQPVIENGRVEMYTRLSPQYFLLSLRSPKIARTIEPGQFVMIEVQKGHDPLLRRPFSAHRVVSAGNGEPEIVEVLVQIVGRGTRLLSEAKPGSSLSVVGPLGQGFKCDGPGRRVLVVGGGCGIAPLPFAAERLLEAGHRIEIYYGAGTEAELVIRETLSSLGAPTHISTDDGSAGHYGLVTDLVRRTLDLPREQETAIVACGPLPMLRAVKALAVEYTIDCQLSLETMMACGFGVCLGCTVHSAAGNGDYVLTCMEGPVFDMERIKL
ncbi:dihydroorotate dehydrogenase electron transfer subunit [Acidobacteriota bacterium]